MLERNVFLMTTPAMPPAFSILTKCWENRGQSPVFWGNIYTPDEDNVRNMTRKWDTHTLLKTGDCPLFGARRQTVIVSVLESLRQHLSSFTLSSVIEEIRRWSETGRSCFARWAEKLGLTGHGLPDDGRPSLLNRVIPVPDG